MFTGLISEVGSITNLHSNGGTRRITIAAPQISRELEIGDSVSVSGVCLTAVEVDAGKSFSADLAKETEARSSFVRLRGGAKVNLELPMQAGARLGGHIVQGHVDGIGKLISLEPVKKHGNGKQSDYWLRISLPAVLSRYVVEKGSITVEGISLTVAAVSGNEVTIAIIPHTLAMTNLRFKTPNDLLNIEVDVLAKYAERLNHRGEPASLTVARLRREGF